MCVPQDDCCQESDEATRALYSSIKRLDPHHILYAPITGSTLQQAWRYHAATGPERGGTPAFDVFTFEHYELPGVGGGLAAAPVYSRITEEVLRIRNAQPDQSELGALLAASGGRQ